jgi:hypothetical protein
LYSIAPSAANHLDWFKSSSNLIALGSVIFAFAAAAYARSMAVSAKKSYDLARSQEARREPKLSLHLADAYGFRSADRTIIAVSINVFNRTDIDNSVARAELAITYHRDKGHAVRMNVAALPEIPRELDVTTKPISLPIGVPSHQSIAGLLLFELPAQLLKGSILDDYTLSVLDSHEKVAELTNLMVREVFET